MAHTKVRDAATLDCPTKVIVRPLPFTDLTQTGPPSGSPNAPSAALEWNPSRANPGQESHAAPGGQGECARATAAVITKHAKTKGKTKGHTNVKTKGNTVTAGTLPPVYQPRFSC
jgi:hypothetical protein